MRLAYLSAPLYLSQRTWCQVSYRGGSNMFIVIGVGVHGYCAGQEGSQIEDRGYGMIQHHLVREQKH